MVAPHSRVSPRRSCGDPPPPFDPDLRVEPQDKSPSSFAPKGVSASTWVPAQPNGDSLSPTDDSHPSCKTGLCENNQCKSSTETNSHWHEVRRRRPSHHLPSADLGENLGTAHVRVKDGDRGSNVGGIGISLSQLNPKPLLDRRDSRSKGDRSSGAANQARHSGGDPNHARAKAFHASGKRNFVLTVNPNSKPATWASIVTNGKSGRDEGALDFFPPEVVDGCSFAVITREEVAEAESIWKNSILAYVVDCRPHYFHLKAFANRVWKPTGKFELYSRDNGFFLFKFEDESDCNRILSEGPWLFDGKLVIVRRWSPSISMDWDLLKTLPLWIRFPSLNLKLWNKTSIAKIASLIGVPLHMDGPTANLERVSYARVFVEVSADHDLPTSVKIKLEDGLVVDQKIEYEWLPPSCKNCLCFGHIFEQCTIKSTLQWRAKGDVAVEAPVAQTPAPVAHDQEAVPPPTQVLIDQLGLPKVAPSAPVPDGEFDGSISPNQVASSSPPHFEYPPILNPGVSSPTVPVVGFSSKSKARVIKSSVKNRDDKHASENSPTQGEVVEDVDLENNVDGKLTLRTRRKRKNSPRKVRIGKRL